jgi:hypothetical protein
MSLMSSSGESDLRFPPDAADELRLRPPSRTAVRLAAVAILALALLGLIRGAISSRPASQAASPLSVLAGLSPAASAAAKQAAILPRDEGWSTLSGPRMVDASEKPKPQAKPAASDDAEDADSASPAAVSAATDAIAPDAPDAPPPAAPAASSNAPPPTPPN